MVMPYLMIANKCLGRVNHLQFFSFINPFSSICNARWWWVPRAWRCWQGISLQWASGSPSTHSPCSVPAPWARPDATDVAAASTRHAWLPHQLRNDAAYEALGVGIYPASSVFYSWKKKKSTEILCFNNIPILRRPECEWPLSTTTASRSEPLCWPTALSKASYS